MKRLLLYLILAASMTGLRADDVPPPVTDTAAVSQHYHEVLARPEYLESNEPNAGERLKTWLEGWFHRFGQKFGEYEYASNLPAFASMLMSMLSILSIAGLIYTIVRLTHRKGGFDAERTPGSPGAKMFRPPEAYDAEIRQAVASADWHEAWLAAWRQFLSRLENRQLVEPDRTRTNREYLEQLRSRSIPPSLLELLCGMVDDYDRFIYGRRTIAETDWNVFHEQINEAGLMLHLEDKRTSRPAVTEKA